MPLLRRLRTASSLAVLLSAAAQAAAPPQTVHFPSLDADRTELVGYLFEPAGPGPHPAVVMLHGRAGPYSAKVNRDCTRVGRGQASPCDASSLSRRHVAWGAYWAAHGYLALHVDSFGPRGRAHGYGRGTHEDPDRRAVNELTVRPLDAEGALAYLAARPGVRADRVMLQGWSNGGSTTLNTVYRQAQAGPGGGPRFRAALAFYPGCGPRALLSSSHPFRADIPLWVFLAGDDEEVSPAVCEKALRHAQGPVEVVRYEGATHGFDDPGTTRQGVPANRAATEDAMRRSAPLFDALP